MRTNTKIFFAKIIFKILMALGFKKNVQITRNKISLIFRENNILPKVEKK